MTDNWRLTQTDGLAKKHLGAQSISILSYVDDVAVLFSDGSTRLKSELVKNPAYNAMGILCRS